jgi:hypothetical protein
MRYWGERLREKKRVTERESVVYSKGTMSHIPALGSLHSLIPKSWCVCALDRV